MAGAFGAVGHSLVAHLQSRGDWQVIGLGRRQAPPGPNSRFIAVDLTDADATRSALSVLPPADAVFFAAYAPRPTPAEEVGPNLAMLQNLMAAVEPRSAALGRVVLLQGSKWYGNHLGPYKTPANEDDPRLPVPHFYYAQQDWLAQRQLNKPWIWSALRPHAVIGFVSGQFNDAAERAGSLCCHQPGTRLAPALSWSAGRIHRRLPNDRRRPACPRHGLGGHGARLHQPALQHHERRPGAL
ncbi:MAG: NAD-dependent epimerase/dehydratase family protein, partial [Janthinobacterium lividum]